MAFDPDAYLSSKSGGFDPDAYLAKKQSPKTDWKQVIGTAAKESFTRPMEAMKYKNLVGMAPMGGAALGTMVAPGVGTAAGAGIGSILQQMQEVASGKRQNPTVLGSAGEAMGQTLMAGFPETKGVQNFLEKGAINQGRRALGYTKRFLNRPGAIEKANDITKTMLQEKVIRPFSNAEDMAIRAESLMDKHGPKIGKAIKELTQSGEKSFDTGAIAKKIEDQLGPEFSSRNIMEFKQTPGEKYPLFGKTRLPGGAFDRTKSIVKEITDTVKTVGKGEASFEKAELIKRKLQEIGDFTKMSDAEKSVLYRKASGIVRQAQDEAIEAASKVANLKPDFFKTFLRSKKVYGAASNVMRPLENRLSSELGNRQLGLTDLMVGGAEAASGGIGKAAVAVGGKRMLERLGGSTASSAMNALANMGGRGVVGSGIASTIAEILKKFRGQDANPNPQ